MNKSILFPKLQSSRLASDSLMVHLTFPTLRAPPFFRQPKHTSLPSPPTTHWLFLLQLFLKAVYIKKNPYSIKIQTVLGEKLKLLFQPVLCDFLQAVFCVAGVSGQNADVLCEYVGGGATNASALYICFLCILWSTHQGLTVLQSIFSCLLFY
jgi:hypothetical protein